MAMTRRKYLLSSVTQIFDKKKFDKFNAFEAFS